MRVIVHAGLHKTGSTSLQGYFHRSRAAMAACGVIYPDFGAANHWRVVSELMARDDRGKGDRESYLDRLRDDHGAEGTLDALAGIIGEHRDSDNVLLISHENFGVDRRVAALAQFLESVAPGLDLTVLAYCREPGRLYVSIVQHYLRIGASFPTIAGWVSPHGKRALRLRKVLGDHLKLRCFAADSLRDGDVVADFVTWFAATTGKVLPEPREKLAFNNAISAPGCALILAAIRREGSTPASVAELGTALLEFDALRFGQRKLVLPQRWMRSISDGNREAWNRVVDLSDHDPAIRARLRIPASAVDIPIAGPRATDRWILSCADEAYATAFEDWRIAQRGAGAVNVPVDAAPPGAGNSAAR